MFWDRVPLCPKADFQLKIFLIGFCVLGSTFPLHSFKVRKQVSSLETLIDSITNYLHGYGVRMMCGVSSLLHLCGFWGLNSGCHVYLMVHLVSPTVAKFNKVIMLLLNFFHLTSIYGKWYWLSIVLSSFSLKYISLSTDGMAGPNDGAAEKSALAGSCLLAEEQHRQCLFSCFCL